MSAYALKQVQLHTYNLAPRGAFPNLPIQGVLPVVRLTLLRSKWGPRCPKMRRFITEVCKPACSQCARTPFDALALCLDSVDRRDGQSPSHIVRPNPKK